MHFKGGLFKENCPERWPPEKKGGKGTQLIYGLKNRWKRPLGKTKGGRSEKGSQLTTGLKHCRCQRVGKRKKGLPRVSVETGPRARMS